MEKMTSLYGNINILINNSDIIYKSYEVDDYKVNKALNIYSFNILNYLQNIHIIYKKIRDGKRCTKLM